MDKRFQYNVATGRITLPIATILSLAMFMIVYQGTDDIILLGIGALITYMIIEFNRVFAIIRTRTFLPSAMFILYYTGCPTLLEYNDRTFIPLLFMAMMFALFNSHNKRNPSTDALNSFLCLSLSSMINPYMLYLVPVLYLCMSSLHSLNVRSFIAGIIGLMAPYVIYATYLIAMERHPMEIMEMMTPIVESPVFGSFPIIAFEDICYGVMTLLLTLTGSVMNLMYTYKIKEECRRLIRTLIIMAIGILLLTLLQPVVFYPAMTSMAIIGAFLNGHLFTIENNRLTNIYLMVIMALFMVCATANIWIHLYNS